MDALLITDPRRPRFITFTGVDDHTDLSRMEELQQMYPIEWGILFSPELQGSGRYPTIKFVEKLANQWSSPNSLLGHNLSAHICGDYSRQLIAQNICDLDFIVGRAAFKRAQINTIATKVDTKLLHYWGQSVFVDPILQYRTEPCPLDINVLWIYDASGGKGILPEKWPSQLGKATTGYAGGLNPDNVAAAVASIQQVASDYWIDMETGVRDDQKRFSLDKCQAVCEAIYGKV